MKYNLAIVVSALAAVTLASPAAEGYTLRNARDVANEGLEEAAMTFVGQAFVDGPNVTLSGTAESIHSQLLALNPAYDAWDFPEYQERMSLLGITRVSSDEAAFGDLSTTELGLTERDSFECNPVGGKISNAATQCIEGLNYLRRLNGYCGAPRGWGGCSRVSCSRGCGIFLCNDNPNNGIQVWCGNLAGDANDIAARCGERFESGSGFVAIRVKGQVFRDGPPAWNNVLRLQDC